MNENALVLRTEVVETSLCIGAVEMNPFKIPVGGRRIKIFMFFAAIDKKYIARMENILFFVVK